ncbi:hypothetical protein GKE82_15880 [Conexibacter sp. W3-3-2]|uniref:Small secreted protein n=1 Tax=Paraconexibacter algicola TaxID=2133960 RepID=A0A2T4UJH6_9ACTN|nr:MULTISPECIES: hypothetical protein [Solirubrobacterales]MTD45727.1 hypothetical protein [Conexibacter sp. W3-3-2]PTL59393.1 hypothetical protein C7Y72_06875 [Paraconexibacter algicola]
MVITSLRSRARTGAVVLGLSASLGLVACGGDDDGGSSAKDYPAALNTFCGNLLTKQQSLQTDVQRAASGAGADPQKAAGALADVLSSYSSTLTAEIKKLGEADVPQEYESFDRTLTTGINAVAKIASTTATRLEGIDLSGVAKGDTSGLMELQSALGDLAKQQNPLDSLKAPKKLQDAAPKCDELSKS